MNKDEILKAIQEEINLLLKKMQINYDKLLYSPLAPKYKHFCPLCGRGGELLFNFHCSNKDCKNYENG